MKAEKVEIISKEYSVFKKLCKFVAENINLSPAIAVSCKKIPLNFTIRIPLNKVLKNIK